MYFLGVTKSFLHLGMWSSTVGVHIDDYDLISLNYLHHGAPKIWYIIHPSSYSKFEELVNQLKLFSEISSSCLSPLQHKTLLINPTFLHLHAIEYYRIEQKINEIVVIFPGTYHFSFDTGFNLNETIKYALPSWLQFQRRSPRLCSCSISSATIIHLNRRFFTSEILSKFQAEHLTSKPQACIDLSAGNSKNALSIVSRIFPLDDDNQSTIDLDLPLYSSSCSANTNTPTSIDIISSLDTHNEQEDIWNIFERISSRSQSDSTPYLSYASPIYPYSTLRTCIDRKRAKRRKCYGCRRHGHLKKECPYFSHQ